MAKKVGKSGAFARSMGLIPMAKRKSIAKIAVKRGSLKNKRYNAALKTASRYGKISTPKG